MAIFLIKDRDATHPDIAKDLRGCYKRGDIVEVFKDDKPCVLPPAPPFWIVKVSGLTKAQALRFMAPEWSPIIGPNGERIMVTRRAWRLDMDLVPRTVLNTLAANRYYETTFSAVRTYVRNKLTGDMA